MKDLLQKHMQGASPQENRRKDLISHHILRLAYCRCTGCSVQAGLVTASVLS